MTEACDTDDKEERSNLSQSHTYRVPGRALCHIGWRPWKIDCGCDWTYRMLAFSQWVCLEVKLWCRKLGHSAHRLKKGRQVCCGYLLMRRGHSNLFIYHTSIRDCYPSETAASLQFPPNIPPPPPSTPPKGFSKLLTFSSEMFSSWLLFLIPNFLLVLSRHKTALSLWPLQAPLQRARLMFSSPTPPIRVILSKMESDSRWQGEYLL